MPLGLGVGLALALALTLALALGAAAAGVTSAMGSEDARASEPRTSVTTSAPETGDGCKTWRNSGDGIAGELSMWSSEA